MVDVEAIAQPAAEQQAEPRRAAWRGRGVVVIGALVLVLVTAVLYFENAYMPLTQGSTAGPDTQTPGSLFIESQSSIMDNASLWTWCFTPGGTFAWSISLANDGPLPITILGSGGPEPVGPFNLVDFAAHEREPSTTSMATDPFYDNAAAAPLLAATTMAPGDELQVWARFKMQDVPVSQGGIAWIRYLPVRYSVLGLERTVDVPMRDGVGVVGRPCPTPSGQ